MAESITKTFSVYYRWWRRNTFAPHEGLACCPLLSQTDSPPRRTTATIKDTIRRARSDDILLFGSRACDDPRGTIWTKPGGGGRGSLLSSTSIDAATRPDVGGVGSARDAYMNKYSTFSFDLLAILTSPAVMYAGSTTDSFTSRARPTTTQAFRAPASSRGLQDRAGPTTMVQLHRISWSWSAQLLH